MPSFAADARYLALGFFAPGLVHGLVFLLHLVLPARGVEGYVRDAAGNRLRYRLNGLLVLGVVLALAFAAVRAGDSLWVAVDWHAAHAEPAGAYVVALRFDRAAGDGLESIANTVGDAALPPYEQEVAHAALAALARIDGARARAFLARSEANAEARAAVERAARGGCSAP